jgi:hypothetical protein
MNLPEHMIIELNSQDEADLSAARAKFVADMHVLTDAQKLDRAAVIAGGLREADPLTRAMAQQVVDAAKARTKIEGLQAELKAVEAELKDSSYRREGWRGEVLTRKEALTTELEHTHARLLGIAEADFTTARRKAAVHFRNARAAAAKNAAFNEAIARAEAKLEAEELAAKAEGVAKARRYGLGKAPERSAGNSQ